MEINTKLQRIKNEDFIWIIYFFIIIASLISNHYERQYINTKNFLNQKKCRCLNITIFVVAFFIYLYFVLINYENVSHLKKDATQKEVLISHISLIAAILFLIAGIFQIIAEVNRSTQDFELGL